MNHRTASILPDRPRLLILGCLAGFWLCAAASAAVLALSFLPQTPFLCGPGCLDRRLALVLTPDGAIKAGQAEAARRLVASQLRLSPFDAAAWLRLAALEFETSGTMTPAAVRALDASYRFAPVSAEVARWRLVFTFDHWREAGPAVRASAALEMRSLGVWEENRRMLRELERQIVDPTGRLAFHLVTQSLR